MDETLFSFQVVPTLGIEPRLTGSESVVLPLDEVGIKGDKRCRDFLALINKSDVIPTSIHPILPCFSPQGLWTALDTEGVEPTTFWLRARCLSSSASCPSLMLLL